ncbi:MAG: SPOR domain-containing protein [Syntrophaceae bacterium]|nr:SPOR domain-containing protein [Syntrophaceae bacterium]
MEIKKTRKEFPPLEEIEKIIGYDALLGKSDNSHVLNMSAEMKSAQKKSGNQSSQKTAPIDTEKLDAKMSNEVPDETDRGHYSVQVAALSNALAAEELTTRLIEEGFQAYMEQTKGKNGNVLFRIRIGKYDVRPDAEKALEQLVKSGRTGFVSKN